MSRWAKPQIDGEHSHVNAMTIVFAQYVDSSQNHIGYQIIRQ